jgi:hypothetical protein
MTGKRIAILIIVTGLVLTALALGGVGAPAPDRNIDPTPPKTSLLLIVGVLVTVVGLAVLGFVRGWRKLDD